MNIYIQINVVINKINNFNQFQAVEVEQQVGSGKKSILTGVTAYIPFVILKIITELFDKFQ
jgi:hypothetical protein